MDVQSDGEALDITGEEISEGHVGTESGSLNAYGSPVARDQNVHVAEPRNFVNRVVRNSYFAFVARVCLSHWLVLTRLFLFSSKTDATKLL